MESNVRYRETCGCVNTLHQKDELELECEFGYLRPERRHCL